MSLAVQMGHSGTGFLFSWCSSVHQCVNCTVLHWYCSSAPGWVVRYCAILTSKCLIWFPTKLAFDLMNDWRKNYTNKYILVKYIEYDWHEGTEFQIYSFKNFHGRCKRNYLPRRAMPEWSPREEEELEKFEEVEVEVEVEEGGGKEYRREQEYTRFLDSGFKRQ